MKYPSNLLCVKSIITILLTTIFCYLTITHPIEYSGEFKQIIIMVITFYFTHQYDKMQRKDDEKK